METVYDYKVCLNSKDNQLHINHEVAQQRKERLNYSQCTAKKYQLFLKKTKQGSQIKLDIGSIHLQQTYRGFRIFNSLVQSQSILF